MVELRKPVDIWEASMPGRGKSICIGLVLGAILACSRKSHRANMAAKSGVVEKELVGLAHNLWGPGQNENVKSRVGKEEKKKVLQ